MVVTSRRNNIWSWMLTVLQGRPFPISSATGMGGELSALVGPKIRLKERLLCKRRDVRIGCERGTVVRCLPDAILWNNQIKAIFLLESKEGKCSDDFMLVILECRLWPSAMKRAAWLWTRSGARWLGRPVMLQESKFSSGDKYILFIWVDQWRFEVEVTPKYLHYWVSSRGSIDMWQTKRSMFHVVVTHSERSFRLITSSHWAHRAASLFRALFRMIW